MEIFTFTLNDQTSYLSHQSVHNFLKKGHRSAIRALAISENEAYMISGGGENIKLWTTEDLQNIQSFQTESSQIICLTFLPKDRFFLAGDKEDMPDEVLCAKFTPSGYYYAVSLLNQTIQIHFSDSDRLFLSLYGHKLPIMSFDISSDGALLVSGSADKNVKIWGMDFGNCHKSIFAHSDGITCVQFVKDTHYFFSCSKDRIVKYWDGDSFQQIMHFEESLGEIWSIAIGKIGDFFICGSGDKLIRKYKQTKDQVFVQEEEEKRMEKMLIEDYTKEQLKREVEEKEKKNANNAKLQDLEVGQAIKKKYENLKCGEDIMAAIDTAESLREEYIQFENDKIYYEKNKGILKELQVTERPCFDQIYGLSIPEYVGMVISKIKTTELENSLSFLHCNY
ncbi:WD40 repeat protein [Ichthyophthirius multifiliis]|uniref:WD40 repeat protein n=1 Tax=Ichthyophthirius multifiliis TaxID=5932 RepID=G0QJ14_ICHMU|nr:WD40 repeat protein [Ichthyophthirius multifiliis]EGR34807.1 WD40 repeat protein [Ichthyophthirius multifiliis]|eukprot:XP_004040111.1 WD40 repeat protein [Ichthyophthirius multifiliis]